MLPKFYYNNKSGIVLIAAIMMIIVATIAVVGITTFILERSRFSQVRLDSIKAQYAAQAGIEWAIYQYRLNGYYPLGQQPIDGNKFTITCSEADLLKINTNSTTLNATGLWVQDFEIQNATNTNTLTIDRMIVTWNNAALLTEIRLNNQVCWSLPAGVVSGTDIDLTTNFILNTTPTLYNNNNRLIFSANMTGSSVSTQFKMLDGSTRTTNLWTATVNNNFNFTIESKGEIAGSNIYKSFRAEYNANTSKIVDTDEK